MDYSKDRSTGLIGYPLTHSWSPLIHNSAFQLNDMKEYYQLYEIMPDQIGTFLSVLPENIIGLNVTIPHKETVLQYMDTLSDDVRNTGSVNTIVHKNGSYSAHNTDVDGIRDSIEYFFPGNKFDNYVILGAGGTAKTAVYTIRKYFSSGKISVIYRNETRLKSFRDSGSPAAEFIHTDSPEKKRAVLDSDLIINCTPAGMFPATDEMPLNDDEIREGMNLFDLIYNPLQTKLMRMIAKRGGASFGGLRMLVIQAARSFRYFTGRDMPVDKVYDIVKREFIKKD